MVNYKTDSARGPDLPSFRIKRSHKKSRNGCAVCKRRRVKCDESRPGCNVCKRRGLDCAYEDQRQLPATPDSADGGVAARDSKGGSSCPSPVSPITPPSTLGVLETELVQHYLSHTLQTFSIAGAPSQAVWRTVIPALAFSSTVVRHGMLTLAALCLCHDSKHTPEQSLKYLQAAEYYGDQFVEQSSRQLRELKPSDIDTNLACARLLTALSFGFFRIHQHRNGVPITESPAWIWLHMLRGTSTVHIHYHFADETPNEVMARDLGPEVACSGDPHVDSVWYQTRLRFELHPQFPFIRASRQERFAAMYDAFEIRRSSFQDDQAEGVLAAINMLASVTEILCEGEVHGLMRTLGPWPAQLTRSFVELVTSGNLFALAIHTHWLMLICLCDEVWWIDDMGQYGISEISALCDAEPSADVERSILEWPRRMLAGTGSDHGTVSGDGFDGYGVPWEFEGDPLAAM